MKLSDIKTQIKGMEKIGIGSDHAGYDLKDLFKEEIWL